MSIIRYQTPEFRTVAFHPLARLSAFQNEVDRLLDLPVFGRASSTPSSHGFSPALDLYQDKDNVLVRVELPGMKRENIRLSLHEDTLTISGDRHAEKAHDEKGVLRNERFFGAFERSINLPVLVDGSRVTAVYEDGILTVTLPKAEQAKPRQIEIHVK